MPSSVRLLFEQEKAKFPASLEREAELSWKGLSVFWRLRRELFGRRERSNLWGSMPGILIPPLRG